MLFLNLPPGLRVRLCTAVIIVERRHHFHRELVIASALASVAIIAIILSTFYAWVLWRRSRRLPDGKAYRSSGLSSTGRLQRGSSLVS
jgi:hypothetical protein